MKKATNFARAGLVTAIALAAVSACGRNRPSGTGSAPKPVASAGASQPDGAIATARRLCEVLHAHPARRKAECCGTRAARPLVEECVRVVQASLEHRAIRLDEAAVEGCEREMQQRLAGCDWVTPGQPLAADSCRRAIHGELEAGRECRSSLECRSPLHCAGVTPTTTGVCTAPAAIGSACGVHTDALASYTLARGYEAEHPFCAEFCALVNHKCEPVPVEGGACFASVNCATGQTCRNGRCSALPPATEGESCGNVACASGLRCNGGTCTKLARPGEACSSDFDCELGGCIASGGERRCGMKCASSLSALASSPSPALRLPLRPRGAR